jgi:hypothetical membrane protein
MELWVTWMLATGAADNVAELSGEPQGGLRILAGSLLAGVLGFTLAMWSNASAAVAGFVGALLAASTVVWLLVRRWESSRQPRGALAALWVFVALFVGAGLLSQATDLLPRLYDRVPPATLWVAGIGLVLIATSNGLVRLLLTVAGAPASEAEDEIRGGRLLGPLERLILFGLGIAGELTAAVIVIAAKSLLRFPEMAQRSRDGLTSDDGSEAGSPSTQAPLGIDRLTEYLVVGSLASWAIALGAVALYGVVVIS